MRKGYDSLSALVSEELKREVLGGDLFLFVARNRIRAKVLHFDGTGLCLYAKRLEKGRFACLWRHSSRTELPLSRAELALFLEGSQLIGKKRLGLPKLCQEDLAIRS
jgi:transposase